MKTIVLGIGNTLLSDDGVGVYVARELAKKCNGLSDVTVKEAFSPGFELVENLVGFDKAIIVDSIISDKETPGQVLRYSLEDFRNAIHISSYHDMNFPTAVELARKLKLEIPDNIVIFAVTVEDILTLREACTEEVEKAIPIAVEMIMKEINQ